ncbi:MAG: hypothetical protein NWE99_07980 [Candidatus Bathyarchaeota archaeon]|nr:hypothetical protein [Candidatus Bathyarchaeota archaeon]
MNPRRIIKKLPALLCDGDTSKRSNYNAFMRRRYQLTQFRRRSPARFNMLTSELFAVLEKIDMELQVVPAQKRKR